MISWSLILKQREKTGEVIDKMQRIISIERVPFRSGKAI